MTREERLRRAQETALAKWNKTPGLPKWDCEGVMVLRVVGWRRLGPLYYLTPPTPRAGPGKLWLDLARLTLRQRGAKVTAAAVEAEAELRQGNFERSQKTLRRSVLSMDADEYVADLCNRFLAELKGKWLRRAEGLLQGIDIEGQSVAGLAAVRRLRAVAEAVRKTPKTPRDVPRRDVIHGLREVLGREPTNSEAALASILCGSDSYSYSSYGGTLKDIEHEVNAMRPLLAKKRKTSK